MARKSAIEKLTAPVSCLDAIRTSMRKRAATVKETSFILDDDVFAAMHLAITEAGATFEDIAADLQDVARHAKVASDSPFSRVTARDVEAAYRLEEKRRRRERIAPFADADGGGARTGSAAANNARRGTGANGNGAGDNGDESAGGKAGSTTPPGAVNPTDAAAKTGGDATAQSGGGASVIPMRPRPPRPGSPGASGAHGAGNGTTGGGSSMHDVTSL